jgi:hypothetical protein
LNFLEYMARLEAGRLGDALIYIYRLARPGCIPHGQGGGAGCNARTPLPAAEGNSRQQPGVSIWKKNGTAGIRAVQSVRQH